MTAASANGSVLLDTNVLVYAHDRAEPAKRAVALQLVELLTRQSRLVLSAQVLNEFYAAVTRPTRPARLDHATAAALVRDLSLVAPVLPLTASVTLRALDAMPTHGLSFWDALVWAAARENAVPVICTEDFQHGRDIDGVRFVNPFVAGLAAFSSPQPQPPSPPP